MRIVLVKSCLDESSQAVRTKVEMHITDSIMNSMATEVANDVKQILSNKELREDIRSIVREKLREFTKDKP